MHPPRVPVSGQSPDRPSVLCSLLPTSPGFSYSPDLHSPGEGELRRSHRETVVSRVREMPAFRHGESPVLRLPSPGSAHLQQRHDCLDPEIFCPLSEKEVKAKARSLKGREPDFFPHPPALSEKKQVGVWGPGRSYWEQLLCSASMKEGVKDFQKKGRKRGGGFESPLDHEITVRDTNRSGHPPGTVTERVGGAIT